MRLTRLSWGAAVLALGFLVIASACGGGDDAGSDDGSTGNGASAGPITVTLKDNVFEPNELTVPVNTDVEITVTNEGSAIHNMHVLSADKEGKDFKSDAMVNPGRSSTFTVRFTTKGKFDFQCDYHLPDMAGVINVQ